MAIFATKYDRMLDKGLKVIKPLGKIEGAAGVVGIAAALGALYYGVQAQKKQERILEMSQGRK
jgi:hypothetical protein